MLDDTEAVDRNNVRTLLYSNERTHDHCYQYGRCINTLCRIYGKCSTVSVDMVLACLWGARCLVDSYKIEMPFVLVVSWGSSSLFGGALTISTCQITEFVALTGSHLRPIFYH